MQILEAQDGGVLLVDQRIQYAVKPYRGFHQIRDHHFRKDTLILLIEFLKLYDFKLPDGSPEKDEVGAAFIESNFQPNHLLTATKDLYQLALDYEIEYLEALLKWHYNRLPIAGLAGDHPNQPQLLQNDFY